MLQLALTMIILFDHCHSGGAVYVSYRRLETHLR